MAVAERLARRLARRRLRSLNRSHAELRASAFARDETGAVHETSAYKPERPMASPHGTDELETAGRNVFNLCANYCPGLADDVVLVGARPTPAAPGLLRGARRSPGQDRSRRVPAAHAVDSTSGRGRRRAEVETPDWGGPWRT